jgi:signal transduction histidine kinase/CheY-like chemotaxis protein
MVMWVNETTSTGWSLSTAPAGPGQRRLAYAVLAVSVLCFAAIVPFAQTKLTEVWAFIPIYESALAINDLITAVLLLGQAHTARSRALMALAAGYLFTACMAVPHALTFPGLFAPTGLLGAGRHSTAWLYMFWHGGFPLCVMAYLGLRDRVPPLAHATRAVAATVIGAVLAAVALAALATAGADLLPAIMTDHTYLPAYRVVVGTVWVLNLLTLPFLLARRRPTMLDLWLAVVAAAWVFDIALSAVFNAGRFDLGFYAGRIYGFCAATFVLIVLLAESTSLHARLARSLVELDLRHRELERSREQLYRSQKMEMIGQLTGGIAHDFNNLLTVVMGNLDMAEQLPEATHRQRRFLTAAQHAAERGARLTAQLLAFGRRQMLLPQRLNINGLLDAFAPLLRRALDETMALSLQPAEALWPATADPAQLEAALLNLALNARDAMPQGGRLSIATCNHTRPDGEDIGDEEWRAGDYVAIVVADTGTGMAPEVMEHVFEPFFTTKEPGKGSGLGLSQVYGFAKQMGGHVTVASAPGQGTTITLFLPRATPASAAEAGVANEPPERVPAAEGRTILVVEDDDEVRLAAIRTLSGAGYRVLAATNGTEALAVLGSGQRVDLLFTDVVMPQGVSGAEVARSACCTHDEIRVLLTSGYALDVLAANGCDHDSPIFAKPYRPQDLVREVGRALEGAPGFHHAGIMESGTGAP